jgi:ribosomal protein S18 acetylase RimI-like enzyme
MSVETARKVKDAESLSLAGVLARAFEADPMSVHLLPDQGSRLLCLEYAFRTFLRRGYLPQQECYTVGSVRGGALWLPPGKYPPSIWRQLSLLPDFTRIFGLFRTPGALRDLNCMEKMHPLGELHWYLAFLGVAPSEQGKGLGSALMKPVLNRCDAEGMPAYLETSNERNLPLYQRHGFKVVGECDIPKGPHFWGMWREARTADNASNTLRLAT